MKRMWSAIMSTQTADPWKRKSHILKSLPMSFVVRVNVSDILSFERSDTKYDFSFRAHEIFQQHRKTKADCQTSTHQLAHKRTATKVGEHFNWLSASVSCLDWNFMSIRVWGCERKVLGNSFRLLLVPFAVGMMTLYLIMLISKAIRKRTNEMILR